MSFEEFIPILYFIGFILVLFLVILSVIIWRVVEGYIYLRDKDGENENI